ncbi:MAG: hypothetical protein K1Y36_23075 [Blastocatellia bacterium]|nr:hypothetical protein [Blastocatellia bacterium]
MNARRSGIAQLLFWALAIGICAFGLGRAGSQPTTAATVSRIQFCITAIEAHSNTPNLISETLIEGPPGTDFNLNLKSKGFVLTTRFLTDLLPDQRVEMRAALETRRYLGQSDHNLPLYEIDTQRQSVLVGTDEAAVLFPFGQEGDSDSFKIVITQNPIERTAKRPMPLEIKLVKPAPNGEIEVTARKIPHRFVARLALVRNGQTLAQGESSCRLEAVQEIKLIPAGAAPETLHQLPVAVALTVSDFTRSRPQDTVGIHFDVLQSDPAGAVKSLVRNGAGVGTLGEPLKYDLTNFLSLPNTGTCELIFTIRLAEGESSD